MISYRVSKIAKLFVFSQHFSYSSTRIFREIKTHVVYDNIPRKKKVNCKLIVIKTMDCQTNHHIPSLLDLFSI